jgi:hypothetical protein
MSVPSASDILAVRKRRLSLQREADLLEQEEKGLTGLLIAHMNVHGIELFKDGDDEVSLVTTEEPNVTDWPKLLDFIVTTGSVDLLQKRVTASAVKARWADDVEIPGVTTAKKQVLKFNV